MITLRLDKALKRAIDFRAKTEGVTRSEMIRKSLISYFNQSNALDPFEAGKEYFGRFSSGNPDLSEQGETILRQRLNAKHAKDHC